MMQKPRNKPLSFCSSLLPHHAAHNPFKATKHCKRSILTTFCKANSFEVAIKHGVIRDFGRAIRLKKDGSFPQPDQLHFPTHWDSIIHALVQKLVERLGTSIIVAIYLRGSCVTGNAFHDSRSDIDLLVFIRKSIPLSLLSQIREEASTFVKSKLDLSGADIAFINVTSYNNDAYQINPSLQIIVTHYAVPVYRSLQPHLFKCKLYPVAQMAIDIRNAERQVHQTLQLNSNTHSFKLQAIKWLVKRCLRALVELAVPITNCHCRDLVPCYHMNVKAFPEYKDTFFEGLLIACACKENNFSELPYDFLLERGLRISRHLVELCEEIFLNSHFKKNSRETNSDQLVNVDSILPSDEKPSQLFRAFSETLVRLQFPVRTRKRYRAESTFRRFALPAIPLQSSGSVQEFMKNTHLSKLSAHYWKPERPLVLRKFIPAIDKLKSNDNLDEILWELQRNHKTVSCRVASSNEVTFCRRSHSWITSNMFSPPSVLKEVPVLEAIERMRTDHTLSPLYFRKMPAEVIYIQTLAASRERLLETELAKHFKLAQRERIWISNHGVVSTLHYDASYSALLQRCGSKRMIFFPPDCLKVMGIYPLGHPLHRRARVSLKHKDSLVFKDFWVATECKALEVVLQPGDIVFFPPEWAHYTESLSMGNNLLSVSHTLRYF